MKQLLPFYLILMLFSGNGFAQVNLDKIAFIESSNNHKAHNKKSGAYGTFQITQIALDDFNAENDTKINFKSLKEESLSAHIATWLFEQRIPQLIRNKGLKPTLNRVLTVYNCGITCLGNPLPNETVQYLKKYHKK